jgi:ankyrin repeat protein
MSSEGQPITLTGATLMGDAASPADLSSNPHNHSHSHSHSHGHCVSHGSTEVEMSAMETNPSIEDLLNSSTEEIVKSLSTLLRFGRYEALQPLLEKLVEQKSDQLPAIFAEMDEGGHSVLHWAAKRVDDIRFLNTMLEILEEYKLTSLLNVAR